MDHGTDAPIHSIEHRHGRAGQVDHRLILYEAHAQGLPRRGGYPVEQGCAPFFQQPGVIVLRSLGGTAVEQQNIRCLQGLL